MVLKYQSLLIFFLFYGALPQGINATPLPSLPVLQGQVVEFESLRPLVGVKLSWAGIDTRSFSGLGGEFSMPTSDISWPAYLKVQAPGYLPRVIEILAPGGRFSVSLRPDKKQMASYSPSNSLKSKEKVEKMEIRIQQEAAILANQAENLSLEARWLSQVATQKPPKLKPEELLAETRRLEKNLVVMRATYSRLEKETEVIASYKLEPGIEVPSKVEELPLEVKIAIQREEVETELAALVVRKTKGEEMLKKEELTESEWQSLLKELQAEYAALDQKCRLLIQLEEKAKK